MFRQLESLTAADQGQLDQLRQRIRHYGRVCVAYSGGVDSALVAAIAQEQLAEAALAVTGISPALAPHLREEARLQAQWLGIAHQEVMTAELQDPAYATNPADRCYACKRELHRHLAEISRAAAGAQVLDGVNHDDLGDHRPGIDAAREAGVCSPLAELQIDKATVRRLSKALGFPWWDKPAQPCLASRFPYGEGITASRLSRVAQAERWLQQRHFDQVRVRSQGETARIEVPAARLAELMEEGLRQELVQAFLQLGFTAVSLDLEGLVSGKLNRSLQPMGTDV
ncbi:MAG: ATP-dependent sacrificial sulfur transferase LarE [Synechococcus sp. H1_metabat_bins_2.tsv.006]|nr:ATP-dependent sacrificial sulfur transferase LarE [Synechococcus sp. H1_metabat_bins_2.tsv.006]